MQRGSAMEDLRVFLEAADEEADLPTAGSESTRLEDELGAGLRALKLHRREQGRAGVRQMQQMRQLYDLNFNLNTFNQTVDY